jgi:hypothetical protein
MRVEAQMPLSVIGHRLVAASGPYTAADSIRAHAACLQLFRSAHGNSARIALLHDGPLPPVLKLSLYAARLATWALHVSIC